MLPYPSYLTIPISSHFHQFYQLQQILEYISVPKGQSGYAGRSQFITANWVGYTVDTSKYSLIRPLQSHTSNNSGI